ncbi:MAG: hypothetical protein U0X91_20390 [Spirosomataceae bacterium]
MKNNLLRATIAVYLSAILIWTLLFWKNPYLKNVLVDIHAIYTATILAYFLMYIFLSAAVIDIAKIFIRTLFRVWLLIIITFAVSHAMDRVGILLSLTFIFGYIEGLLDISKWLERNSLFAYQLLPNKMNHALGTVFLMSIIHIVCAIVVLVVYLLFQSEAVLRW